MWSAAASTVVGQAVRLVAEQPQRSGRRGRVVEQVVAVAGAGRGEHVVAGGAGPPRRRRRRVARATRSRWNRLPARARTALPLYGSTPPPASTTAPAPAASAVRMMVPTLPGSLRLDERDGEQPGAASSTSVERDVDGAADRDQPLRRDGLGQRGGVLRRRSRRPGRRRRAVPTSRRAGASASAVANSSTTASGGAAPRARPAAPSARKRPVSRRAAPRVSRRAAASRALESD